MSSIVVDTSVLVEHPRGNPRATVFVRREAARGAVLVPSLVEWELWKGAETEAERTHLETLLDALVRDPFVASMARPAGVRHQAHRRAGTGRPAWDLLIASLALVHGLPLATLDDDCAGIDGLDVIDVS